MALNVKISADAKDAAADAISALVDVGSGTPEGKLRIYSGAQPVNPDTAPAGTLLAELDLANPGFAASSGGICNVNGLPLTTTAVGAGVAAWCRFIDRDGNGVIDGSVGTSGCNINLTDTTIGIGDSVSITACAVDMPVG